jgi:uncharacterized protein YjdB
MNLQSIFRAMTLVVVMLAVNSNVNAQAATATTTTATATRQTTSELTFTARSVTSNVGESRTLTITGLERDERAEWTSSNSDIVTVDRDGKITAQKEGKATITATAGSRKATCEVAVVRPVVSELAISARSVTLEVRDTKTLTVSGLESNERAEWTSSSDIVTVDKDGKITAQKVGKATVTATVGTRKTTCEVTVSAAATNNVEKRSNN